MLKKNIKEFLFFIKNDVKWSLVLTIFLFQFLPTIYKTTRIFFLGTLPDENAFNIASQVLWLNILYEIIIESIVIPLFYLLPKIKDNVNFKNTYTTITISIFAIFLVFTIVIFFSIDSILHNLITSDEVFKSSSEYIKLEVWGMLFYSMFSYLFLTTTILRYQNYLSINIFVCLFYSFLTIIMDLFFVAEFSFSLNLSVKGVGINSMIVNAVSAIILIIYLSNRKISIWSLNLSKKIYVDKQTKKQYICLFLMACLEVSVRNLCFYFMVIKPINELNNSGIYWVTNNFIWSWLLLPITTLSIYIKETFIYIFGIENKKMVKKQLYFYCAFVSLIVLIWILTIPVNHLFIRNVLGVKEDYQKISQLVVLLIPSYVAFAYSLIIDSIFIRQGKINYYCIQSLIVNLTVYPIYFILWNLNIWVPTLESICVMFGVGMIVHLLVNLILLKRFFRISRKDFVFEKNNYTY